MSWLTDQRDRDIRRLMPDAPSSPVGDYAAQQTSETRDFYNSTFRPEFFRLREIAMGMGEGNAVAGSRRGIAAANSAFNNAEQSMARDTARRGALVDADTSVSQNRRFGLARIIAQVDAGNRGIASAGQMRTSALQGMTQSYGDLVSGGGAILSRLADAESERNRQIVGARADHINQAGNNAGASAGTLMSLI